MQPTNEALLEWWRRLAFVGHYSGAEGLVHEETNRVLRYHSVGGGFYDDISPQYFREQLDYFTDTYDVVDLPAVLERGDRKRVALTFDDGYRDFYDYVLPLLHEYDVPATVFVLVDALEDPEFAHNDRFDYEYMTEAQLRELVEDDLVTVGNHTRSHPRLPEVAADRLETEIGGAKDRLEDLLGAEVSRFCYPYGAFDVGAATVVRRTHDFAVVNRGQFEGVTPATDPATIPRVNGANPFFEVCWDLSDTATRVGSVGERVLGLL